MNDETHLYFELLEKPDRVEGIATLLLRRNRLSPSVLVLCPNDGFAAQLDERLWTIKAESFLAHAIACDDTKLNAQQPILLATSICRDNNPTVLINGGLEVPTDLSKFSHIVDFVDGWDKHLKQVARERWSTYKQLNLEPKYIPGK